MTSLHALLSFAHLPCDGCADVRVQGITATSQEASEGMIFVALHGHRTDGHEHVRDAYRRGARLFLCEHAVSLPADAQVILTKNSRKSSAEMMSCLYGQPCSQLSFLGITGTKGKTTVAHGAYEALRSLDIPCALVGTTGLFFDGRVIPTGNTTPDLFFLYPHLAAFVRRGVRTVILEASSQALADGRIDTLPMHTAVFTSFGRDHIGRAEHADEAAYLRAKQRLFSDFHPRYAVLNADDTVCRRTPTGDARRVLCSLGGTADVSAELISMSASGSVLRLDGVPFHFETPGEHFARNMLLAAVAVSTLTSRSVCDVLPRMEHVRVPGRMQILEIEGRHAIVDYAHNAMSFRSVAQLCRRLYHGRLIAVFGSVGGRGYERRRELAEAADELFDLSILTADDTVGEETERIVREMYTAFLHKERVRIRPCRADAIYEALSLSAVGDTVLLLGKGDEVHPSLETGGEKITDRSVLERYAACHISKKSP